MRNLFFTASFVFVCAFGMAQSDSSSTEPRYDYQIYLKQPAQQILELKYDKDCTPINGTLNPEGKRVIMKDYEKGSKVYLQILYFDGTVEELRKSPCYIDPVIL